MKAILHDENKEYDWFVWDGIEDHLPEGFKNTFTYTKNGLKLIVDEKVIFVGAVVVYSDDLRIYKNIIQAKTYFSFPDFKNK